MAKSETLDINGKPFNRGAMVMVLLIGTFAGMLMQMSLGTAIPTLMHDFNISLATAQEATTYFLLANGIMVPVSAYLTTKIPTKYLYMVAYTLLLAGMATTAFTPSHHDMWWMFLLGRILAAVAVGITMPLMQVVMVNIFPAKQRGAAMGINGIVIGLAPAIGPTLSGWILEKNHHLFGLLISNSWRTIFYLPMIVLVLVWIATPFFVKNVVPNRDMKLDFPSLILAVIGFGSFLWGFSNSATDGFGNWPNVLAPILVGILVIIVFVFRQLKMDDPFLNVRVFKNKQFTLTTFAVMMAMMAMMGVEMMLPTYLQNVHGMSALESGLTLLPGALVIGAMSPVAGAVYDKVGAKRMAMVGFSILAIGTVPFLFLTAETPQHLVTLLYALRMFGIATTMMPLTASAMSALPPEEASQATAANNTVRQIGNAVVVALLSSVTQNVIKAAKPAKDLAKENVVSYMDKMINATMTGFHASFAFGIGFAVVGIILAFFLHSGKLVHGKSNGNVVADKGGNN